MIQKINPIGETPIKEGYSIVSAKYLDDEKVIEVCLTPDNHNSRQFLGLSKVPNKEVATIMDDGVDYFIRTIDQFNSYSSIPIENDIGMIDLIYS